MVSVLREGINPILTKLDFPELSVKVGIDEGENVVVQYGYDQSSPIDILGYGMNVAAKITSLTESNKVSHWRECIQIIASESSIGISCSCHIRTLNGNMLILKLESHTKFTRQIKEFILDSDYFSAFSQDSLTLLIP